LEKAKDAAALEIPPETLRARRAYRPIWSNDQFDTFRNYVYGVTPDNIAAEGLPADIEATSIAVRRAFSSTLRSRTQTLRDETPWAHDYLETGWEISRRHQQSALTLIPKFNVYFCGDALEAKPDFTSVCPAELRGVSAHDTAIIIVRWLVHLYDIGGMAMGTAQWVRRSELLASVPPIRGDVLDRLMREEAMRVAAILLWKEHGLTHHAIPATPVPAVIPDNPPAELAQAHQIRVIGESASPSRKARGAFPQAPADFDLNGWLTLSAAAASKEVPAGTIYNLAKRKSRAGFVNAALKRGIETFVNPQILQGWQPNKSKQRFGESPEPAERPTIWICSECREQIPSKKMPKECSGIKDGTRCTNRVFEAIRLRK
jgi:hypothetical protein